ncbi:MAG: hypothetical protein KJ623_00810 [Nanoarchaeota archaeon]|nr:hypothetical protein [Nanoarchaeota archaeon]MBU0963051.1 hypothetical protein [Nanoarchaeota archaeon]
MEPKKEVYISEKALSKLKNDRFIREKKNKKWYLEKILSIVNDPIGYHHETIGKFSVGPRGHEKRRIVWSFSISGDTIKVYIADLLYHISSGGYVGSWDIEARERRITPQSYNYIQFKDLRQVVNL